MSRWPPDSGARLKASALALFAERGFANVTAAEIAASAGMTERTFFRHFRAKEDVLFEDYAGMDDGLTEAVANAPEDTPTHGLMQRVADFLGERLGQQRDLHRTLARVVTSDPTLRARALLRDQQMSEAVARGFMRRGFPASRATLLATLTAAALRLAYENWVDDLTETSLAERFQIVSTQMTRELAKSGSRS